MANSFAAWNHTFTEDGQSAIDGLREVFDDENNTLLLLQLDLTLATGAKKEVLERSITLEKELHKARTATMPLLTEKQKEDAPKIRKKIEEALKILEQFQKRQQVEANLLEKDERKEDISDIDKDIKTEEDSIKNQIKETENLAKAVKDIDEYVKSKIAEKSAKEANYEDTALLLEEIENKSKERQQKYQEFNEKRDRIDLSNFNTKIKKLEEKKKEKEAFLKKVEQSKVIIDYVKGNLLPIVVKLVSEPSLIALIRRVSVAHREEWDTSSLGTEPDTDKPNDTLEKPSEKPPDQDSTTEPATH